MYYSEYVMWNLKLANKIELFLMMSPFDLGILFTIFLRKTLIRKFSGSSKNGVNTAKNGKY